MGNPIKEGSIWIDSDQYGIVTSCSLCISPWFGDNRSGANNLYNFNFSCQQNFKKKKNNLLVHMTMSHIGIGSDLKDALL
jgi:hypothetical protein